MLFEPVVDTLPSASVLDMAIDEMSGWPSTRAAWPVSTVACGPNLSTVMTSSISDAASTVAGSATYTRSSGDVG